MTDRRINGEQLAPNGMTLKFEAIPSSSASEFLISLVYIKRMKSRSDTCRMTLERLFRCPRKDRLNEHENVVESPTCRTEEVVLFQGNNLD